MTTGVHPGVHTGMPPLAGRRRAGRRRRVMFTVGAVTTLLAAGAVWVAATAFLARGELEELRTGAAKLRGQLTEGDLAAAASTADSLADHGHRAHSLTSGPAWFAARHLPVLGAPFATFHGVTTVADDLAKDALPGLVTATRELNPAELRDDNGRYDVQRLAALAPTVDKAAASVAAAVARAHALPGHTWMPTVDAARADLLEQLGPLADVTRTAAQAARILPAMLGAEGTKNYLLVFQNNAEARGTGGLPGAFAVLRADHGAVQFTRFAPNSTLVGAKSSADFGPEYQRLYENAQTTSMYGNANLSPHFPYSAQIWADMWRQRTRERVDGVLALDPQALAYLLDATGPAVLADGTRVTARNVVELTESTAYTRFGTDEGARTAFLLEIARTVGTRLVGPHGSPTALVRAFTKAASERRVLAWSTDDGLQAELGATGVGGSVPQTTAPYAGLSIVNEGGNKLDYYLDRSLTWAASGCTPTRDVTVTVTLTNRAPRSGLPTNTVAARSDRTAAPNKPGDHRVSLAYAATTGAQMRGVTLDGKPGTARIGTELGHPVYTVDVELPRGESRTVVLQLREPASPEAPIVLRQPLVRPLNVTVRNESC